MILEVLRTHLGVQVWLGIFAIAAFVLLINAFFMKRAGLSLRPVLWFAGFLGIVGLPQLAFHVYDGLHAAAAQAPRQAALDAVDAGALDTPEQMRRLFGPDVDPSLVSDARPAFAQIFDGALSARFAAFPSGESVLLARFPSAGKMEDAWIAYLAATGLTGSAEGDSERGFAASRAAGDRVYVLPMSTMLGVWTGPTDHAIRARMAAGGFAPHARAPLAGASPAPTTATATASGASIEDIPLGAKLGALGALLALTVVYFFRGAAWAGRTPAAPVAPLAAEELYTRLLSVNDLDVPFRVEPGDEREELFATWRYADAKWIDIARAHGVRRVHRIAMRLDEDARAVRATDYAAGHDWSAGAGGASIRWQKSMGITFYQYEHQRVFGLQIGPDGRFQPAVSHAYTFDLQEMKAPLIAAVTKAGWTWQPVLLDGPRWLRWLTAALLVAAPALAHAAPGLQPAGPWRFSKAAPAPWVLQPPEPLPNAELRGKLLTFLPGSVEGPAPLGCANARYEFAVSGAGGLFQGSLPAPADRAAQALGIAHRSVATLQVSCDTGVFDYHLVAERTLVLGFDNVVWTLQTDATADSPEAVTQNLLVGHMTHDMAFTPDTIAPKRSMLTPALALAVDAYFARPMPADEPPPINGDPFTDSQEYPSRFTLEDAAIEGDNATVPIVFSDGHRTRRVVAVLRRADGAWLVDDLRYENGTFRDLLK